MNLCKEKVKKIKKWNMPKKKNPRDNSLIKKKKAHSRQKGKKNTLLLFFQLA